jgi:hypothetical protein
MGEEEGEEGEEDRPSIDRRRGNKRKRGRDKKRDDKVRTNNN